MTLIDRAREYCRQQPKRIVFPDAHDERLLRAARHLKDEHLAQPILLGSPFELREFADKHHIPTRGLVILHPQHVADRNRYVGILYGLRKEKGLTLFEASQRLDDPLYMGAMLLREAKADLCIAGNLSSTADVLRAAIQIIGVAPGLRTISSFFAMIAPDGQRVYAFADAAVLPNPSVEQLADVALATAAQYERLQNEEARVALLSFSTKGSAQHPKVDKVRQAFERVTAMAPHIHIDGELQFDAAFVQSVAARKAPNSPVAGKANVFIFPDLNSGNIGYKLVERLAGYKALGPFLQGLSKPMHDLSRGCGWEHIVEISLTAAYMAKS
ncbi:MAG TPA: phosphate acetyltransferase [bacterium]|nr:phosphate acetyltransferase [bacterium]HNT65260.1 phosphate acetyltransferase [bacterium]HOX86937.1 phosphate acetyltransferase [bacterium]HPG46268.1 phosphate acetyltransferase [bacterium]HPM98538.1 phosphate acetyltransferase [bacterium]